MSIFLNRHPDSREFACFAGTIIVLEGLIAVGKSTLGLSLCQYLNRIGIPTEWIPEEIPQSLLNLYLSNMKKYAFSFQVIIAQERSQKYNRALELAKQGKVVIIDRGLLGDVAFATMQKEFGTYLDLISGKYPQPHYTVFLNCPIEICFERLKIRASYQKTKFPKITFDNQSSAEVVGYSLEYFKDLRASYEKALSSQSTGLIRLNWNRREEIKDGVVSDELCKRVLRCIVNPEPLTSEALIRQIYS